MININELQNLTAFKDVRKNYKIKHPITNEEISLLSLCKYYQDNSENWQEYFTEYANKALSIENQYGLFVCYDEEIMALKKLSKLEIILLIDIMENKQGKIDAIKDYIFFASYNNEVTFADAIHQLLIKNTLNQIGYQIAVDTQEIQNDNEFFK